ncbi:FG-GAP repeat domain-containing protein [Streptomyces zaomyceticus]|uniref:FG-GAP repeat domain-containing protein n=1 Tax=Streptomyces zaomyceticus TaxID=68286 RepID=UPI00343CFDAE
MIPAASRHPASTRCGRRSTRTSDLSETAAAADFDGDGRTDLLARDADGTLRVRFGRGDTAFNAPRTAPIRW